MPCTRSMRSKPSGKRGDEVEMPPPRTRSTRTTRAKKDKDTNSSQQDEGDIELFESPPRSASASSTRSTRAKGKSRTKAKPIPVEEEIDLTSPSPPRTTRTRSTRQKTTAASSKASSVTSGATTSKAKAATKIAKPEEKVKKIVKAKPKEPAASSTRAAQKRTRSKAKAARTIKSTSEESDSDAENEDLEPEADVKPKNLSVSQLRRIFTASIKTSFSAMDVDVNKVKSDEEQQRYFESVFFEKPPLPPNPKAKTRAKRARSPGQVEPETKKDVPVPKSFDFSAAGGTNNVPAAKKYRVADDEDEPISETKKVSPNNNLNSTYLVPTVPKKEPKQPLNVTVCLKKNSNSVEDEKDIQDIIQQASNEPLVCPSAKAASTISLKEPSLDVFEEKEDEVNSSHAKDDKVQPPKKIKAKESVKTSKKETKHPLNVTVCLNKNSNPMEEEEDIQDKIKQASNEPLVCPPAKALFPTSLKEASLVLFEEEEGNSCSAKGDKVQPPKIKPTEPVKISKKETKHPLNVTVCLNKNSNPMEEEEDIQDKIQQASNEPLVCPPAKALSQTSLKEASLVLFEEEEGNSCSAKGDKVQPAKIKPTEPVKISKKETKHPLNVTVCLKKNSNSVEDEEDIQDIIQQTSNVCPSANALSQTFVKEPSLNVLEEEEDVSNSCSAKVDNIQPPKIKPTEPVKSSEKERKAPLNVTVCLKKYSTPVEEEEDIQDIIQQASNEALVCPSANALSRTFVKEPSLDVLEEEEDEVNSCSAKGEKVQPLKIKPSEPIKSSKKGVSSSSSTCSSSSMKSASSQPSLTSSTKKLLGSASKTGSTYGSTGKLNEVHKSKALEEAERRKQEIIRQRQEASKKKMEEWKKKAEKAKLEEEKKKQNIIQQKTSHLVKKPSAPTPSIPAKPISAAAAATGGTGGFLKPKYNFGPASSAKIPPYGAPAPLPPSLPKHGFISKPPPTMPDLDDLDDSFKSATNSTSFLDSTTDFPLSSYDITVYEDLDEDLKHRENKTVPKWATDKEALKTGLYSMVLLNDPQYTVPDSFPRPDKSYKLFPGRYN